jgi:hypothetical protein
LVRDSRRHLPGNRSREANQEMERVWKLRLIEKTNPNWEDLYETAIA